MALPRLTYDQHQTPGILAENAAQAYCGLGILHGRHRSFQALLLHTLARGRLAECLASTASLVRLDALARRLDLANRAADQVHHLDATTSEWLDAYLDGFRQGLDEGGKPWELRLLAARLPPPDRASVLAGLMVSSYLGLAQSQERMELALVEALKHHADPQLLTTMFSPHLQAWQPGALKGVSTDSPLGFAAHGLYGMGGSNVWAVGPERSHGGRALFAADPHLQINQLPALFFEIRARVADDYWLGATVPGLPGLAIGRNRFVAFSGTFSCADNIDLSVEHMAGGEYRRRGETCRPLARREIIGRRWARARQLEFFSSDRGSLMWDGTRSGDVLAVQWAAPDRAAVALGAYMRLATAKSADEAATCLQRAHTLSLHYVIADRSGELRYLQAGRVPRRSDGWSGLYPVDAADGPRWSGFYEGADLPHAAPTNGWLASANEARPAPDGGVLATLAQPTYRLERIAQLLVARRDHDLVSMQAMQGDVYSRQGELLAPLFLQSLDPGPLHAALSGWDKRFDAHSRGAHAFDLAYGAALKALSPELGGEWFTHMLSTTEIRTWWSAALDGVLKDPTTWTDERRARLKKELTVVARSDILAWGDVQTLEMGHLLLGSLPRWCGFRPGPYPLPGARGTVLQGYGQMVDGQYQVTAPAYRFVTDMGDDAAWTSLPGGIDGSWFSPTYDCWVKDYLALRYHRLAPPTQGERS